MKVGLVSDTHGMVDEQLASLLRGVALILHAGDVCGEQVIAGLEAIAPVRAIHGNCDGPPLSRTLPPWRLEVIEGWRVLVVHDLKSSSAVVAEQDPDICVSGHSHHGVAAARDGILFVNPGSAGRKRFKLLRSCGVLEFSKSGAVARVLSLEPPVGRIAAKQRAPRRRPGALQTSNPL